MNTTLFLYEEIKKGNKSLFLFHGTGGSATDLFSLVEPFATEYTLVGLEGNTNENGMKRFFKRKSEGIFDMDNLREEADKLEQFITEWNDSHKTTSEDNIFIGYSNGANFILATMFWYPQLITKAALLHPMMPFEPPTLDLSGHKLLVSWGENDPIIPKENSKQVIKKLTDFSASVTEVTSDAGHNITAQELNALHNFIAL